MNESLSTCIRNTLIEKITFKDSVQFIALLGITINATDTHIVLLQDVQNKLQQGEMIIMKRRLVTCDDVSLTQELISLCWGMFENVTTVQIEGTITVIIDEQEIIMYQLNELSSHAPDFYKAVDINMLKDRNYLSDGGQLGSLTNSEIEIELDFKQEADVKVTECMDQGQLQDTDTTQFKGIHLVFPCEESDHEDVIEENKSDYVKKETAKVKKKIKKEKEKEKVYSFHCDKCDMKFWRNCDFVAHARVHTGEKLFNCHQCEKAYTRKSDLNKHKVVHSDAKPNKKLFKCGECGKEFKAKYNLKTHIRTHTNERPYKCDLCEKSFKLIGDLKTHRRIHTGEKPFKCTVCDAAFYHRAALKQHSYRHTGEKPYQCEYCSQRFTQSTTLKTHIRIHTQEMPYQCEQCGAVYRNASDFARHRNVHRGIKPFSCDECSMSFVRKAQLDDHKICHTDLRPFSCMTCLKMFKRKSTLQKHQKKHYNGSLL